MYSSWLTSCRIAFCITGRCLFPVTSEQKNSNGEKKKTKKKKKQQQRIKDNRKKGKNVNINSEEH